MAQNYNPNDPTTSGRAVPYQPRTAPIGGGRQTGGPGGAPGVFTPPTIDPGSGTAPTGGGRQTGGPGGAPGAFTPPTIQPPATQPTRPPGPGATPRLGGMRGGGSAIPQPNPGYGGGPGLGKTNPVQVPTNPPAGGPTETPTGGNPWVNPGNANLPWQYFAQMLKHFSDWHNGGIKP